MPKTNTPCIGTCSCTYGDAICRGCKRYDDEVRDWNGMDDAQKAPIWDRLSVVRDVAIGEWFSIADPERLAAAMDKNNIRRQPQYGPLGWLDELLRACKTEHPPYERIGVVPIAEVGAMTLPEVRERIQDRLLAESFLARVVMHPRRDNELEPGGF